MNRDAIDLEDAFRRHHAELFRFLARECGDAQDAQDAVQEAFIRLHRSPPRDPGAVRSWLFRTGLNVLRDEIKVRANRRALVETHAAEIPQPRPGASADERVERSSEVERLRAALDSLRERERTALLMRESGFKHREIAEALGTTTGTVGTLVARSLEKLSQAMGGGAP